MADTATLVIKFLADTRAADAALSGTSKRASKFGGAMKKALAPAAAVAGGLAVLGTKAVAAASELEQAQGAVESVYGKSAAAVDQFAKTSVARLGLSESAYKNFSAALGASLQNAGFSAQQAAGMSDKAMGRAADLAATYGGTTAEAVEAIQAAVSRSEFDPLEKFNVTLSQTKVNAELAKRGQDKLTGAALENAKAQATLDLFYQQSSKAAGQSAREADTVAGQQQRAAAAFENAAATIGTALLPAVAAVGQKLVVMANWVSNNSGLVLKFAAVLAGLAAAVFAVNAAFAVYTAATRVWTAVTTAANLVAKAWNASNIVLRVQLMALAVQEKLSAAATVAWTAATKIASAASKGFAIATRILNAALRANPIGLVITALVALGAGLVLAYKKSATFRAIVNGAFSAVKKVVMGVINWFTGTLIPFFTVRLPKAFRNGWTTVKKVTVSVVSGIVNFVRKLPARIVGAIASLPGKLRSLFSKAWSLARKATSSAISAIVGFVRKLPGRVIGALSSLGGKLRSLFSRVFSGAKNVVSNAITAIVNAVKALPGKLGNLASSFGSAGKKIIEAFVNGMKNAAGIISGIAGNVWSAVKSMLNTAIDKINSALEFRINLPGPKDITVNPPNIPHLAEGGIVTSPTLAVIGDNKGPWEAVVPSEKADMLGGGGDVTVEVHLDGRQIGHYVDKRIDRANTRQARRVVMRGTS